MMSTYRSLPPGMFLSTGLCLPLPNLEFHDLQSCSTPLRRTDLQGFIRHQSALSQRTRAKI
jgi:hypothetical protein